MQNQSHSKPQRSSDPQEQFKTLCLRYAEFLKRKNVKCRPFRAESLPLFSKLTHDQKNKAILEISSALEIFEEMKAEGQNLSDSPKLIWRGLKKLGWTPRADIFDKIGEDVVIIYSAAEQKQIFQNLRFFDFTSFTLEDIYASPWYEYSKREPWAEQKLQETGIAILTGAKTGTFDPGVGEHLIEEVGTEELLKTWIEVKHVSPLTQGERPVGILVVNHCRRAGSALTEGK